MKRSNVLWRVARGAACNVTMHWNFRNKFSNKCQIIYFQVDSGGVRLQERDDTWKRIFRNIWQYFEIGKILRRRIQKSLQLRALRDTPAKAPENVWGDFPKSNSTKSSLKYQNILWTKGKRQFQTKNENTHFLKGFVSSNVKEKLFHLNFPEEGFELWAEIDK